MKEQILKLRLEGKSYKEIQDTLNCSKSTISYHCGEGQKEKTRNRTRKIRIKVINRRLETFKNRKRKNLVETVRKYQKRIVPKDGKRVDKNIQKTFTWRDVVNKFGENTKCYLTGEDINIFNDENYSFDHIIPVSKGGDNSLENLGIVSNVVNRMKTDLTVDELLVLCKKILDNQNTSVV